MRLDSHIEVRLADGTHFKGFVSRVERMPPDNCIRMYYENENDGQSEHLDLNQEETQALLGVIKKALDA